MGQCKVCGKSGWFFIVSLSGLCNLCARKLKTELPHRYRIIQKSLEIVDESEKLETRLSRLALVHQHMLELEKYEKCGIQTTNPPPSEFIERYRQEQDKLIVSTLESEVQEASEKSTQFSAKERISRIDKNLGRIEKFQSLLSSPALLDKLKLRLNRDSEELKVSSCLDDAQGAEFKKLYSKARVSYEALLALLKKTCLEPSRAQELLQLTQNRLQFLKRIDSKTTPTTKETPVTEVVANPNTPDNLLETPVLEAYFKAREHETYYRSFKHKDVAVKRATYPTLIEALERLIGLFTAPGGVDKLDAMLSSQTTIHPTLGIINTSLVAVARKIDPHGSELLNLSDRLDFETLQAAYRQAVKIYHPDCGGRHEDMVAVNHAYRQFHELIAQSLATGMVSEGDAGQVTRAKDYLFVVGQVLMEVTLDDWAVDRTYYWLMKMKEWGFEKAFIGLPNYQKFDFVETASLLLKRLVAANMGEQAATVKTMLEIALHGSWFSGTETYRQTLLDQSPPRVVINHIRQAENALRLGIINEKRNAEILSRLGKNEAEADQKVNAVAEFCSAHGFLRDLPTDPVSKNEPSGELVPAPDGIRIETLLPAQKVEYLQAFGSNPTFSLIKKYRYVRLTSILRSVILKYQSIAIDRAIHECQFLSSALGGYYFDDLARFCQRLRELDEREREETLQLLQEFGVQEIDYISPSDFEFLNLPLNKLREVKEKLRDPNVFRVGDDSGISITISTGSQWRDAQRLAKA